MIFWIAFSLSFLGSLQLGPVNFSVLQTAISKSASKSLYISIGGAIPEFIYCYIAVCTSDTNRFNSFLPILEWAIVPVLLFLGIKTYYNRNKNILGIKEEDSNSIGYLFKGLLLAILNFQLLPFWIGTLILIREGNAVLFSTYETIMYSLGAFSGALFLLLVLTYFAIRYRTFFVNRIGYAKMQTILCFIYIALGMFQTVKILLR